MIIINSSQGLLQSSMLLLQHHLRNYISRQTQISVRNVPRSIQTSFSSLLPSMTSSRSLEPPLFDPFEPAVPVAFPIKSLEDLESRSYFKSFHFPFNKSSVNLQVNGASLPDRPRILVCHDMAGGYIDDKWVQGGDNPDAFAIWHWYLIDVFVYFSHTLVTLPPPCWTNTGHKHGVKVLGTFIAEWDEGRIIANKLLSTEESAKMYAERLAELATALGFDGWLINMEVTLDVEKIPNLKLFVSHLTKTMHSSLPGSLVIWYDSVTIDGKLSWQNQLNENNKPFFDISDGIFVNYSWEESYPKSSAAFAGDRKFDVYMGIDVFGRNTYGGGQWTTNVALDVLKEDGMSAAIFAPGWVYETKQPPDFETAQNRWWDLVEKSWGVVQKYPQVLPFYSSFGQGRGYHLAIDGRQVSSAPWNNISSQGFQPFLEFKGDRSEDSIEVLVDFREASYDGGGNIMFRGTLEEGDYFTTRLFHGELVLGDSPVHFTYSVKSDGSSLISLSLEFSSPAKEKTSVLLASGRTPLHTMNRFSSRFSKIIAPYRVSNPDPASEWVLQHSSVSMNGLTLTEIHAVCHMSTPELHTNRHGSFSDEADHHSVPSSIEYFAILGHITVNTPAQNVDFPPSTSWLVEGEYVGWTSGSSGSKALSIKITWKLKKGGAALFPKYNIFVERVGEQGVGRSREALLGGCEYLGVALVCAFYVSELVVPSGTSHVKFVVQVCGADGPCQKIDDSPSLQLAVEV